MASGSELGTIFIQLATLFVQFLPRIVACTVGFVLLTRVAPDDPLRRRARIGLALIAIAITVHLAVGATQMLVMLHPDDPMSTLQMKIAALLAVAFLAECASAAGLVVIVMALCAALRAGPRVPPLPPSP